MPAFVDIEGDNLIASGRTTIATTDTRVKDGTTERPYMISSNKVAVFIPALVASQERNYDLYTGYSPAEDFDIIIGTGGYITVDDDLELGDSFEVEVKGWIDTTAGADKNIVWKEDAFKLYISAEGSIKAEITGGNSIIATDIDPGVMTIRVKADGVNLEIYVEDMVTPVDEDLIGAAVPDEGTDWLMLQNDVMPYAEYIKIRVG